MDTLISVRAGRHLLREEDGATHEQKSGHTMKDTHLSVLPEESLTFLELHPGEFVVDATAGEGGHSTLILKQTSVRLLAIDADPTAVTRVRVALAPFGDRVNVVEGNFSQLRELVHQQGEYGIDKILFDLGWNRTQLFAGRGFSFTEDEPLNMSYGSSPASGFTAEQILNTWSEETLANVFFGYGEEKYAKRIAKHIVATRTETPFTTTLQLVEAIRAAVPMGYRHGRIHPATRTFQALRIAVNDELHVLEQGLSQAWELLRPQGRIIVITFHSIEDRIVKRFFKTCQAHGGVLLTKKPVVSSAEELQVNPSARSAKLRAIAKV